MAKQKDSSSGTDNGGGGFGPYGGGFFGRFPSQQVKVEEKNELKLLLNQYRTSIVIIFMFLTAMYVAANLMFGRGDWFVVVNFMEVGFSAVIYFLIRRHLFSRDDGWDIFGDGDDSYLSTNTVIAALVGVVVFAYIHVNATGFLVALMRYPEGAILSVVITSVGRTAIIFFTISMVLPTVALVIRLIWREIPDQYHGDIEIRVNQDKLALDWAKFEEDKERYWDEHTIVLEKERPPVIEAPIILSAPDRVLPSPSRSDDLFKIAIVEFLDGLESGEFGTDERSWKGKRLAKSGYDVTAIGDKIRDGLIRGGWAEWVHPDQPSRGWRLTHTSEEIKRMAFLDESKRKSGKSKSRQDTGAQEGSSYTPNYPIGD